MTIRKQITTMIFYATVVLCMVLYSCDREENLPQVTNPQQAILGKWEITHLGNGNQLSPVDPISYEEYLPDSVMLTYVYEEENFYDYQYWFNDSLLAKSRTWITYDGAYYDTITITEEYRFEFIDHNILRLDIHNMTAIFYTSIYKRIN